MTEREIYEKHDNLCDIAEAKKKKKKKNIDGFRKKLMIPNYEISKCPEHKVKSKIGNIFADEKILEQYCVTIYKIDPYFYEHYKELTKVDKNGHNYMLFKIDSYFLDQILAAEIDEKYLLKGILFLRKKDKKHCKKK